MSYIRGIGDDTTGLVSQGGRYDQGHGRRVITVSAVRPADAAPQVFPSRTTAPCNPLINKNCAPTSGGGGLTTNTQPANPSVPTSTTPAPTSSSPTTSGPRSGGGRRGGGGAQVIVVTVPGRDGGRVPVAYPPVVRPPIATIPPMQEISTTAPQRPAWWVIAAIVGGAYLLGRKGGA